MTNVRMQEITEDGEYIFKGVQSIALGENSSFQTLCMVFNGGFYIRIIPYVLDRKVIFFGQLVSSNIGLSDLANLLDVKKGTRMDVFFSEKGEIIFTTQR